MANTTNNKVIANGEVLIDLTQDTAVQADVLTGKYFHLKSGERVQGTCTFDADTKDATASANEILNTKTAYVNGVKITGNMANNGAVSGSITTKAQEYTVPQGYHDGSGKVSISADEQAKIIATNILQGVTILGVEGSVEPSSEVHIEPKKSVTPTYAVQSIKPADGYQAMAEVEVAAITVTKVDNEQGGVTVTIGPSA